MSEKMMAGSVIAGIMIVLLSVIFGGEQTQRRRHECQMEAMKTNRSAEDISKICR